MVYRNSEIANKYKVIGIIAIVIASVAVLGCIDSSTDTSPQPKVLITTFPLSMLPTINEMPDGSKKLSEFGNETYAIKMFRLDSISIKILRYRVNKFPSIDEAIDNYRFTKNQYSDYKLSNVNLGDESLGFEEANVGAKVVFRKANIIVQVDLAEQFVGATLSDAIDYAEKVRV